MEKQVSRRNKRYKAKRLFFTGRYTARQIAAMVEVTEATMSKWTKRFGWKTGEMALHIKKVQASGLISPALLTHLEAVDPELYNGLIYEVKIYMGIEPSNEDKTPTINAGMGAEITALYHELGLTDFAGININQVDKLTSAKAQKLLAQLKEYALPPFEVTIKK